MELANLIGVKLVLAILALGIVLGSGTGASALEIIVAAVLVTGFGYGVDASILPKAGRQVATGVDAVLAMLVVGLLARFRPGLSVPVPVIPVAGAAIAGVEWHFHALLSRAPVGGRSR